MNFTGFYDADARGPLAGSDLQVKNSWGLAAHIGGDYWISEKAAIRADLRWIDIDADVRLNGSNIGKVEIDPVVAGISYVRNFSDAGFRGQLSRKPSFRPAMTATTTAGIGAGTGAPCGAPFLCQQHLERRHSLFPRHHPCATRSRQAGMRRKTGDYPRCRTG